MIQYQVLEALVGSDLAQRWHNWLVAAMRRYSISDPSEQAHWLAQYLHESGGLKYTVELWGPTPAQLKYQTHPHLGNTEPGDGFRYRGRGLPQLTGRHNYAKAAVGLGLPLLERPELLEIEKNAADVAAWYWVEWGIPEAIRKAAPDREAMLLAATKVINGGLNGLDDRRNWLDRAEEAMGLISAPVDPTPDPAPEEPPGGAYEADILVLNQPLTQELAEQVARASVTGEAVVVPGRVRYRARPASRGGTKLDVKVEGGTVDTTEGKGAIQSSGMIGSVLSTGGAFALALLPVLGVEVTPELEQAAMQFIAAFGLLAINGRVKAKEPITGFWKGTR